MSGNHIATAEPLQGVKALKADPSVILSAVRAIRVDESQVVELRAMDAPMGRGRPATVAGFFDDDDALVKAAMELDRQGAPAIYITLNQPDPAILARGQNRVENYAKHLTTDAAIMRRVWLPIDIDPVRLAGISATDAEVKHAEELRVAVAVRMQEWFSVGPTIIGFSGNGYGLLYRLYAPNTPEVDQAIAAILKTLNAELSNEKAKVDTTSGNAARIWKCYGTVARKGDATPNRPHRLSRILFQDESADIIPTDALLQFAREHAPQQASESPPSNGVPRGIAESAETLKQYLTSHGVKVKSDHVGDEGKKIIILDGCPMNPDHGHGTDTAVVLRSDGVVGFECKHDSCQKHTWPDVRTKIDPEWTPYIDPNDVELGGKHYGAGDAEKKTTRGKVPPTDSIPDDPGPPWYSIGEIAIRPEYARGFPPVTTGYHALDVPFRGGVRPESFYILAARTGNAKTTLAMNIARRTALAGNGVLVFKLEESPTEALWRIHAAAAQVPLDVFLDGRARELEYQQDVADGWNLIRDLPIRFSDQRNLAAIRRISQQHADQNGKLIIVDQLSMIEAPGTDVGYERATHISNTIRLLARDLHLPILVLVQVNRAASMKNPEKDVLTINDLRDSGCLENDAAGVILINRTRPSDGPQFGEPVRCMDILIGKNRYGPTTDPKTPLQLLWWPRCCRIEDAARPAQEDAA